MTKQAVTYTALITVRNSGNGYVSEEGIADILTSAINRELLAEVLVSVFAGEHLSTDRVGPYEVNEFHQMERCHTKTVHFEHREQAGAWATESVPSLQIPSLDMDYTG